MTSGGSRGRSKSWDAPVDADSSGARWCKLEALTGEVERRSDDLIGLAAALGRAKVRLGAAASKAGMSQAAVTSVMNGPAMMQLTRTVGPKAWAKPTVSAFSPALAAS